VRPSISAKLIAVGLVVTLAVGIAAGAAGSSPSAASQDKAYLAKLRPVAVAVHNAVAPVIRVISLLYEPHAGDSLAARDALIHGEAFSSLHSARLELAKLTAPRGLAQEQQKLLAAARLMEHALQGAHAFASESGWRLSDAINQFGDGDILTGTNAWRDALNDAYATAHLSAPPSLGIAGEVSPPSRTAWIFAADRSCTAASYRVFDAFQRERPHSRTATEAAVGGFAQALSWIGGRLSSLPKPTGASALPRDLQAGLPSFKFDAKVFDQLRAGLIGHDPGMLASAVDQLEQARSSLWSLSKAFDRYGAASCGRAVRFWTGQVPASRRQPNVSA
jgi:hypothetical protein